MPAIKPGKPLSWKERPLIKLLLRFWSVIGLIWFLSSIIQAIMINDMLAWFVLYCNAAIILEVLVYKIWEKSFQSNLRRIEGEETGSNQNFLENLADEIYKMPLKSKLLIIGGSITGMLGSLLWFGNTLGFNYQPFTVEVGQWQVSIYFLVLVFSALIVLSGLIFEKMEH